MAVNILKLPAKDNSLVIEVDAEGWARCYLVGYAEIKRVFLGADDFSVIVTRLNEGLSKRTILDERSAGSIDGHRVAWLLSLAEAHHALYIARSGPDRLLFWQEALTAALKPLKTLVLAGR